MQRDSADNKGTGLAGIILAAGASTRLGRPKQLVRLQGTPLIARAVREALQICGAGIFVVTGAHHGDVSAALQDLPVTVVRNAAWQEGIGISIREAVALMEPSVDAVLVMLADQPAVTERGLRTLVAAWAADLGHIAASRYDDTVGVPAIFPREYWRLLLALHGDRGAKSVIDASEPVNLVAMPEAAVDIDTPEDLAALLARTE
jgi:CTP:molybdopterin cytidylyltransferase MocA